MSKGEDGEWSISGFLDWGDAQFGDLHYELSVIHVDHWSCDKELLLEFIMGYNSKDSEVSHLAYNAFVSSGHTEGSADFVYRAMVYLLLFEFNCFQNLDTGKGIFCLHPEWRDVKTLQELACHLWDLSYA